MASESLAEVFGEVLVEHYLAWGAIDCACGWSPDVRSYVPAARAEHHAHVAAQCVERLEQVGVCESEPMVSGTRSRFTSHVRAARPDRPEFPVFRVKEQRDERA